MHELFHINTVRLKYDDTHTDQKFSESERYPSLREDAHETPTNQVQNAFSLRGNA